MSKWLIFCVLTALQIQMQALLGQNLPVDTVVLGEVEVLAPVQRRLLTGTVSTGVIPAEVIHEKIASSLIDALEETPGITKRGEYHSPLVLRGLGGKRLLVVKDGNRRMGNFQGGFMGQNVNVYDMEKVEVIRGPASVRYGPGAVTGIISLTTKSPFARQGFHGSAMTYYGVNNNERSVQTHLNMAGFDHALSMSLRYRKADDYVAGRGEKMRNSFFEDKDARLSYSWENDRYVRLTVESEVHVGGPWGRPAGFNGSTQTLVSNPDDDTWHSAATLVWAPYLGLFRKAELSLYFDNDRRRQLTDTYDTGSGRLSYRQDVRYRNYYGGWREMVELSLPLGVTLFTGTDGVHYRIESPTELTDYFIGTRINNRVSKNAGISQGGIYVEAEGQSSDERLRWRAGIRTDMTRIVEGNVHDTTLVEGRHATVSGWNATTGVVYRFVPSLFLSLQLARSCRMPDATEMFMIASASDGVVYGNPDLNPEYGISVDAGIRGDIYGVNFDLTAFCNFFNDFISQEYWLNSGKKGINYTYLNVEKARIAGIEFSANKEFSGIYHRANSLVWDGMCSYTVGDKIEDAAGSSESSGATPLRNIPPFNTRHSLTFKRLLSTSVSFGIGGDIRYYTKQERIAPVEDGGYVSPAYCLFGASAMLSVFYRNVGYMFRLRGENLADNRYRPFETLVYGMGRNVKLSLNVQF
ncbi:MAG: TonB-dependent receptor [Tannerella sp.]|jgi:outer membrane receptor protein involved in Fe transport|nr:TonB-dependent receptor [Tannerella sp.]